MYMVNKNPNHTHKQFIYYYIGLLNSNALVITKTNENKSGATTTTKREKEPQSIIYTFCAKITPHLTNNVYHNISSTFIEYVPFYDVICPLFSRLCSLSLSHIYTHNHIKCFAQNTF